MVSGIAGRHLGEILYDFQVYIRPWYSHCTPLPFLPPSTYNVSSSDSIYVESARNPKLKNRSWQLRNNKHFEELTQSHEHTAREKKKSNGISGRSVMPRTTWDITLSLPKTFSAERSALVLTIFFSYFFLAYRAQERFLKQIDTCNFYCSFL